MIINKSGITIRLRMSDLRTIGRATQGVRLLKISDKDEISSVAKVAAEEDKEEAGADAAETLVSVEMPGVVSDGVRNLAVAPVPLTAELADDDESDAVSDEQNPAAAAEDLA